MSFSFFKTGVNYIYLSFLYDPPTYLRYIFYLSFHATSSDLIRYCNRMQNTVRTLSVNCRGGAGRVDSHIFKTVSKQQQQHNRVA